VPLNDPVPTPKLIPLLGTPLTVATTGPVVLPAGTLASMPVSLHRTGVAKVPLKLTVLLPWSAPKPEPEIVTAVPTGPAVGDRPETVGAPNTKLPVAAAPALTATDARVAGLNPLALQMRVYAPGVRLANE